MFEFPENHGDIYAIDAAELSRIVRGMASPFVSKRPYAFVRAPDLL